VELAAWLKQNGAGRGDFVALVVAPSMVVVAAPGGAATESSLREVAAADAESRPRWVVWSPATAAACVADGVRLTTCWDIAAVHRLLSGGWRADPALTWAALHGLATPGKTAPDGTPDLFDMTDDSADPVDADGSLRQSWANGGWADSAERAGRWAALALEVASLQRAALTELAGVRRTGAPAGRLSGEPAGRLSGEPAGPRPMALAVAASESAAELLCAELSADGLPMNRELAEKMLRKIIGPRPRSDAEALRQRAARDAEVLRHAPEGIAADLRSPVQILGLLRKVGLDLPDTRASRLRELRDKHPLVNALLDWRKAERIATTYGYSWLDTHLGPDGRLRGEWTGCDGAAGRMTASAGLHNMPSVLRAAVVAEPGHVFVRADLGQIEPRVLAAVSGDEALAAAAQSDDMYAPVAAALGVTRPVAKVAVLGAMYGQTTGHGAQALRRLTAAYPVAMAYLDAGDRSGQAKRDVRTYGGRLVSMSDSRPDSPARAAARGRYGRNALVQGAAAEFFKMWAVTVRARIGSGRIVLCLHDELLVHVPARDGDDAARLVGECLAETARRWAPGSSVRFISDTRVVAAWADAKGSGSEAPMSLWDPVVLRHARHGHRVTGASAGRVPDRTTSE
jgi:DNA polymerase-1